MTRLLLAFAGREIRKPVDSDINALIVAMRTELDCLVKPGVEIVLELDSTAQHVQIDPRQFKQVIANLVTNASEAISLETGTITIQTLAMPSTLPLLDHDGLNDRVRISVLDTGIGISDEVRDHVFEPFFTTQPPWEKLGMGLSVCYGIVMQNGGEITFHSGDTGGTRFDVVLPAARSARPARDCDSAEPEADSLSHVLVLESDASIMDLTARVLREHGYSVLRAHSLAEFEMVARCDVLTLIECVLTSIVKPFDAPTGIEDAVRSAFPGARVIHVNSNGVADGAPRRFDPVRILDLLRS